jgi:hypothetical protein
MTSLQVLTSWKSIASESFEPRCMQHAPHAWSTDVFPCGVEPTLLMTHCPYMTFILICLAHLLPGFPLIHRAGC